ncbi:hypothetical protein HBB16_11960 [Pseudonocardia sp. MCCB 268]|nr:hypothetical protein [Pseudonocardia cytotoxica]
MPRRPRRHAPRTSGSRGVPDRRRTSSRAGRRRSGAGPSCRARPPWRRKGGDLFR